MKDYKHALTFFAEHLARKYIEEEVVNPEHQPMSKSEIRSRDKAKMKKPSRDAKVIKGPPGRMDTPEEARYRLATYIILRGRKSAENSGNKKSRKKGKKK